MSAAAPCAGALSGCDEANDACEACDDTHPCAEDGSFCNGVEFCLNFVCVHPGNDCFEVGDVCAEDTSSCEECNVPGDCGNQQQINIQFPPECWECTNHTCTVPQTCPV